MKTMRLHRLTFTGKEKDEETGYGYFGARYMDHELMTSFISVDRYAGKYPSISPYAYCAWNPIRLIDPTGDTIVVDKYGFITRNDHTDNYVFLFENNKMTSIGELGDEVNIDYVYSNLLQKDAKTAKTMWNPFEFRNLVKTRGEWDLKSNKKTIYGLGNDNKNPTIFIYKGKGMESQDIGNHHFGYVSKAFGLFPEDFILRQAGNYQIKSGTSKPEWQQYENINLMPKPDPMSSAPVVPQMLPPYGDDPRDQLWIRQGMSDYVKTKK
jgi:RHS repeat-associated protein